MATQVKKVVSGPLTALNAEGVSPGVAFVDSAGAVLGKLELAELGVEASVLAKLPPIAVRLMTHAISQKVGDSYAGASEAENPMAYVKEAITETIKQLKAGEWRITSAGGGKVSQLARALARATGQTEEASQSVIDNGSDLNDEGKPSDAGKAFLKALRANEAVKAAIAAIKLEDAAKAKSKLEEQAKKGGDATGLAGLFAAAPTAEGAAG